MDTEPSWPVFLRDRTRPPMARDAMVPVPDFRNFGVWLRTMILVNLVVLAAALIDSDRLVEWPTRYVEFCWRAQPLLLGSLGLLSLVNAYLQRLPALVSRSCVVIGVALLALLLEGLWRSLLLSDVDDMAGVFRMVLLAGGAAGTSLYYFSLRHQAVRPAVDAAQLAALTARIRPHFLFNSLNAVLSLIRLEPKRAEIALESLADLFRALMRDPRDLVPLSEEIALSRQYLDLERLRLGNRLQVEWEVVDVPGEALVPPLMLQPLLENAVYHGIESADEGGLLRIRFHRQPAGITIVIENPIVRGSSGAGVHSGNRLALENIRQRLALYYDLEASLVVEHADGVHRVTLIIPVAGSGN